LGILTFLINFVLMKTTNRSTLFFSKGVVALLGLLFFTHAVMAVDGIIVKSKSSKASYSNMKKNLSLSLSSGFSYRENKSFVFRKIGKDNSFNSVITYQKGNITYMLPYRNRTVLNRFKTPVKPQN